MIKKKLIAVITAGTLVLGGTTTAFAAGQYKDTFNAAKQTIKQNLENLKAKKGTVVSAVNNKKTELGFKAIDKAAVTAKLQELKTLKDDMKKLHSDFTAAKAANDKEKMADLKAKIQEKASQISNAVEALAPFKAQRDENKALKEKIQPLKLELKDMRNQRDAIWKENKTIREDIGNLKAQLKEAKNDSDKVSSLTSQILEKLNTLNDNLTKLNNLKDQAVSTINGWQP